MVQSETKTKTKQKTLDSIIRFLKANPRQTHCTHKRPTPASSVQQGLGHNNTTPFSGRTIRGRSVRWLGRGFSRTFLALTDSTNVGAEEAFARKGDFQASEWRRVQGRQGLEQPLHCGSQEWGVKGHNPRREGSRGVCTGSLTRVSVVAARALL